jgi:hypothetical protein
MTDGGRRYMREMVGAFVLYTAAILFTGWAARHLPMSESVRYSVALIPVAPVALVFLAIVRGLRRMDELQQRVVGEAAVISASVVGFGSFAYGLLESYAGLPAIPMVWVLPALFAVYGLATPFVRRRYR